MDKRSIFYVLILTLSFMGVQYWFGDKKQTAKPAVKEITQTTSSLFTPEEPKGPENEQFYVLENDYQQFVFSTTGAALSEINLTVKSTSNKSIINPVEQDALIQQQAPANERFPLFPYHKISSSGSVEKIEKGALGGYYPLIRRSIIDSNGYVKPINPQYYSCQLLDNNPETANLNFTVTRFEKNLITFETSQSHRKITKTYYFSDKEAAPYCLNLKVKIEGTKKPMQLSSGIPEVEIISNNFNPEIKYRMTKGSKYVVEKASLPKAGLSTHISSIQPEWLSNSNGFFGLIIDPLSDRGSGFKTTCVAGVKAPTRLTLIDPIHDRYPASKYPGYLVATPLPSNASQYEFRVFAGPYAEKTLNEVDQIYADPIKGYNPDYTSARSYHGWFSFITEPFARFMNMILKLFYNLTNSWGLSIILLTVVLKLMLYPLSNWSMKSAAKMQKIAPLTKKIKEKYKKDPKQQQIETFKLYREQGVNPISSIFPTLIQIPFLIAMFNVLRSTFALRGQVFIQGWINNLAAPDVLFSWNTHFFLIGNQFHLLPLLLGVITYASTQLMSTLPKDKSTWTDSQKQQNMMSLMMPLIMTVIFYNFPSGLNLYWISSTLLGVLQNWHVKKQIAAPLKVIK